MAVTPKPNESFDNALKRFKRDVAQSGKLSDLRNRHESAMGKREARQKKDERARKNRSKRKKNNSGGGNYGGKN